MNMPHSKLAPRQEDVKFFLAVTSKKHFLVKKFLGYQEVTSGILGTNKTKKEPQQKRESKSFFFFVAENW